MSVDKKKLKLALLTIHEDKTGFFTSGQFIQLFSDINIQTKLHTHKETERLRRLLGYTQYILQDVWNLESIALSVDWQKQLRSQGKLNEMLWMQFTQTNIDFFHIEFRSIFDYLAKILRLISKKPDQIRDKSFEKMRNWVIKEGNSTKLGEDLSSFVLSCNWFVDMKRIRESIVHHGGYTLVFPEKGRVLFQVYKGINKMVSLKEIMFNENVADFELYAGLYFGYLLAYLEEFAKLVRKHLELEVLGGNPKSYHSGLRVMHSWIQQVLAIT